MLNLINIFKTIISDSREWFIKKLISKEPENFEYFKEMTTPYELRQVFMEDRIDYDEIECPPDFKEDDNFHIVLADDNAGSLALLEIDLEIIIGNTNLKSIGIESLDVLEDFQKHLNSKSNFEIQKVGGDYATYSIFRKVERHPEYRIDFAIIDIIFGGVVYKDDKPLRIDGIYLAKAILEKNPDAEVILFTGSDLNFNSKEYLDIIKLFGKDFLKTNVVFKTPNFEDRLQNFTVKMNRAYQLHLSKFDESSKS